MANRTRRISRSLPKRSLPPIRHRSTAMRNFASRRYSIDHNARRERKRERKRRNATSNFETSLSLFHETNLEEGGAKKSMDVQWREYPSYLSLSARSSILPFYLARSSPMRLPPPMSAGSMDGRYLFFVTRNCDPVFLEGSANYAHHRPPPTVSKTVVLKRKRGEKRRETKKGKRRRKSVFILRTHGDYVRTGEGEGC